MSVTAPQTEAPGQQLTGRKGFPLLLRIMVATIVGYATYYFVRKNLSIAMPVMEKTLGVTKADLGLFLTLHGVLYGVSKFVNGFFGDRCHVRPFMVTGLVLSAIVNVFFGLSSAVAALGMFWMINGWFQGMGFPPCARAFTHWVPPRELATKMSIWNASTNIGTGAVVVMCSYLLSYFGNWRLCFFVPAAIALVCSVFLWFALPDTPPSVGLPEVEGTQSKPAAGESDDWKAVAVKYVFSNPYVWLLAVANFFVYTIRYAVLDWGPTLLTQAKHLQLTNAGWMVAGFELSGMTGALIGGWLTGVITASNKVYDGTTTATLSSQTLSGTTYGSDASHLSLADTAANFNTKDVPTATTVTATGLSLTGTAASDYQLSSASATASASITPATLTGVIAANNKV